MEKKTINRKIFYILILTGIVMLVFWSRTLKSFIADYYSLKGMNYSSRRDYHLSEISYKKALRLDPHNGKLHFLYGSLLLNTRRINEGIAELNRALDTFRDVYLYRNLGRAYLETGEHDKSRQFYEKILATGIFFLDSLSNVGVAYLNSGDTDNAIKTLKEAVGYNNDHLLSVKNLGIAYLKNGEYRKAIPHLEKAESIAPGDITILNNLGIARIKTGEYLKAIYRFKNILKLDNRNTRAYNNLGNTYYEMKEYRKAIGYWAETLKHAPNNMIAKHNIRKAEKKLSE